MTAAGLEPLTPSDLRLCTQTEPDIPDRRRTLTAHRRPRISRPRRVVSFVICQSGRCRAPNGSLEDHGSHVRETRAELPTTDATQLATGRRWRDGRRHRKNGPAVCDTLPSASAHRGRAGPSTPPSDPVAGNPWSGRQLAWAHNPEVAGSNPAPATSVMYRDMGMGRTCGMQVRPTSLWVLVGVRWAGSRVMGRW